MEYEKVVSDALARYESRLKYTDELLRKDILSNCYSWSIISDQKYRDLHYAFGMTAMLRLVFPDQIIKNDIFGLRLEHLFDHSIAELRDLYFSVCSPSSIEVDQ